MSRKWDHCVTHHGADARDFIAQYFAAKDKQVLILASAGFDARSTTVSESLAAAGAACRAIYIREERPDADSTLRARADGNAERLKQLIPDSECVFIDIFHPADQHVVGARLMLAKLRPMIESGKRPTDVVIDMSALSIGISFPLVRYLYDTYGQAPDVNVHVFVTEDPSMDAAIQADHTDQAMYVPGFGGGASLEHQSAAIRLWIPQLVAGRQEALRRIHDFVQPRETCPILPFPARNPRRGDSLLEQFATILVSTWEVDPRSYIYAAEQEPIDLYRTILKLDDARRKVYDNHGGSLLILSPVGSKLLAIGALLAALERDFPVAYLETVRYAASSGSAKTAESAEWPIVHLWLSGVPYAS